MIKIANTRVAEKGRKNSEKNLVQLAQQTISKKTRRIVALN
jgi:hypothetical protein